MSAVISLPYAKCKPLQLTGMASAPLVLGQYNFTALGKLNLSPAFQFSDNAMYVLTDFTFFSNVEESGWIEGLNSPSPSVQLYMSGKDNALILDNPISVPKYFQQYSYIKMFYPRSSPNTLTFSITGVISQNAYSVGIATLVAGVIFTLYEIKDSEFIRKWGDKV